MKKYSNFLIAGGMSAFALFISSCGAIWGGVNYGSIGGGGGALSYSSCSFGTTLAVGTNSTVTPTSMTGSGPFTVTPSLPPGLTLNSTSGVISGTPTTVTGATVYSIHSGSTTAGTISIQTVQGYVVNSLADTTDVNPGNLVCETAPGNGICTLRAAIAEANADGAGTYSIILPSGQITIGSNLLVGPNNINIYGGCRDTSIIDGNGGGYDQLVDNAANVTLGILNLTIQHGGSGPTHNNNNNFHVVATNVKFLNLTGGAMDLDRAGASATITNCIFQGVSGFTVLNIGGAGAFTITGSLFYNNTNLPLEIFNNPTVTISNSTFSNNSATGAAVHFNSAGAGSVLTMTNTTIANNSASAAFEAGGITCNNTCNLQNVIIANNTGTANVNCRNTGGTLNSNGGNLAFPADANCNFSQPTDIPSSNPLLGPIQDNGGPTFTAALQSGSPAIGAAVIGGCPATDQRGNLRLGDGKCDSGSYEAP